MGGVATSLELLCRPNNQGIIRKSRSLLTNLYLVSFHRVAKLEVCQPLVKA